MDSLKLFKIEAVIVDERLTKEMIAKRLGSFIISMSLTELDPTGAVEKKASAPAEPKPVKKAKTKTKAKPVRHRTRSLSTRVQARIDLITVAMGDSELSIKAVAAKTGMTFDQVVHALLIGEQKRVFSCRLIKSRNGVRPIRHFKVIR